MVERTNGPSVLPAARRARNRLSGALLTALASAFGGQGCVPHAPPPMTASRYTGSALSDAEAAQIVHTSWEVLQTSDGGDDVSCDVGNLRGGPVGSVTTFTTPSGVVNVKADYDAIAARDRVVSVVDQINWCDGNETLGPVLGCSDQSGTHMVVVRDDPSAEGILWAHEYGHTRGNVHRGDPSAVMNPYVVSTARRVNSSECANYQR